VATGDFSNMHWHGMIDRTAQFLLPMRVKRGRGWGERGGAPGRGRLCAAVLRGALGQEKRGGEV
jgi:hypothetical protein